MVCHPLYSFHYYTDTVGDRLQSAAACVLGCVQYEKKTRFAQLNGNGDILNDQLKNGEGLSYGFKMQRCQPLPFKYASHCIRSYPPKGGNVPQYIQERFGKTCRLIETFTQRSKRSIEQTPGINYNILRV